MTRPRANAISGPSDPRYITPDQQLAMLMATPIPVASELETFLKTVYARKDLMTWDDGAHAEDDRLADRIYALYTSSGNAHAASDQAALVQALGVWGRIDQSVSARPGVESVRFQYLDKSLKRVLASQHNSVKRRACNDFLYFQLREIPVSYRVYLNLDFDSMPTLVDAVLGLDRPLLGLIDSFKIGGPGGHRADAVVIYCRDKVAAETLAAHFGELIKRGTLACGGQNVPAMTTRMGPGIAIGAEPVQQATGLGGPKKYGEASQSFGTIRSELIAAAIFNFQDNRQTLGDSFATFRQLVAIGFRGYGLDPAHPGS